MLNTVLSLVLYHVEDEKLETLMVHLWKSVNQDLMIQLLVSVHRVSEWKKMFNMHLILNFKLR